MDDDDIEKYISEIKYYLSTDNEVWKLDKYINYELFSFLSPKRRNNVLKILKMNKKLFEDNIDQYRSNKDNTIFLHVIDYAVNKNVKRYEEIANEIVLKLFDNSKYCVIIHPIIEEVQFIALAPEETDYSLLSRLSYFYRFPCLPDGTNYSYGKAMLRYNRKVMFFQDKVINNVIKNGTNLEDIFVVNNNNRVGVATLSKLQNLDYIRKILKIDSIDSTIVTICDYFEINHNFNIENIIKSLHFMLQQPIDPKSYFPKHLLPPVGDFIDFEEENEHREVDVLEDEMYIPDFNGNAFNLVDMGLRLFNNLRQRIDEEIYNFIYDVFERINPENDIRFDAFTTPLETNILPALNSDKLLTVKIQSHFLQFGLKFRVGDIVYLSSIESHLSTANRSVRFAIKSKKNRSKAYCINAIGCTVKKIIENDLLLIEPDCDMLPEKEFQFLIKLPDILLLKLNIAKRLYESFNNDNNVVHSKVSECLFCRDMTNKSITLYKLPKGASLTYAASKCSINPDKKTLIIAPSSKYIDEIISAYVIESFYVVRNDLHDSICVETCRKSILAILESLRAKIPDDAYLQSSLIAINYMQSIPEFRDSNELKYLKQLRPLEFLGSESKFVDYMIKSVSKIVTVTDKQDIPKEHFSDVIIVDGGGYSESSFCYTINQTNPDRVTLYSSIQHPSLTMGEQSLPFRLYNHMSKNSSIEFVSCNSIGRKSLGLCEFIKFLSPEAEYTNEDCFLVHSIIKHVHHFYVQDHLMIAESLVATSIFFKLLGYDDLLIVCDGNTPIIQNEDGLDLTQRELVEDSMKKHCSFNRNLLSLDRICSGSDILIFGQKADIIIISDQMVLNNIEKDVLLMFASATNKCLVIIGDKVYTNELESLNDTLFQIALNENPGELIPHEREIFNINNIEEFLGLVQLMENSL